MGKALLAATAPAGGNLNNARYLQLGGPSIAARATEANAQAVFRVAGTISKLGAYYDATGTGRSMRSRINGANGNQLISPTDTTAGVYQDTTNTDSVMAGDKVDVSLASTGTPVGYWARLVFEATSGHACFYARPTTSYATPGGTAYWSISGVAGGGSGTEALVQCKVRAAGTLRYLQAYISSNGSGFSASIKTRINGADGNGVLTVTAGATGLFEDTSNTDTIADGDLVNYALAHGADIGGVTADMIGCWILSSASNNDLFSNNPAGTTRAASGTASYHPFTGTSASSATEANASIQHGFDARASKLRIYLSANTYSTDGTATFRVAAANGNQTITLTAGATGWFEDTTHTDDFTANQDCCVKIVGGTSGSITIRTIGLTEGPSTTNYSMAAGQGSFALTGQAATLSRTRVLQSAQGSFTLSGQAAVLKRSLKITAGQGSFALTGQAAALAKGFALAAAYGAFTLTGQAATFNWAHRLTAAYGAFALSGQAAALKASYRVTATYGAFTFTGQAATLARTRIMAAARGTFTLSGQAAGLSRTRVIQAAAGSFSLNGQAASFLRNRIFSVSTGLFVVTGIAALLRRLRPGKSAAATVNTTGGSAAQTLSGWIGKTSGQALTFTGKTASE